MVVLLSTLLYTVFWSLQWPPINIRVLLLVISWWYHVTASVHTVIRLSQSPPDNIELTACISSLMRRCPSCRPTNSVKALKEKCLSTMRCINPQFTLYYITLLPLLVLGWFNWHISQETTPDYVLSKQEPSRIAGVRHFPGQMFFLSPN